MKETFFDSKGFKILFFLLIIVIVIIVVINTIGNKKQENEETSNTTIQENTLTKEEIEENTNELEIADLKDKDERTRIQQYCGKFIRYIENKEYDLSLS